MLVASGQRTIEFDDIEWFYHKDSAKRMEFVTLTTVSGLNLTLTANHLIPLLPLCPDDLGDIHLLTSGSVFARRAKVGHCLAVYDRAGRLQVDLIQEIIYRKGKGVYSPMTRRGTVIVNDVFVSCYSAFEHHFIQHSLYGILRNIWSLLETFSSISLLGCFLPSRDHQVPHLVNFFRIIAQSVLPDFFG